MFLLEPFPPLGVLYHCITREYLSTDFLTISQGCFFSVFCIWRGICYGIEHMILFCYNYNIDVT